MTSFFLCLFLHITLACLSQCKSGYEHIIPVCLSGRMGLVCGRLQTVAYVIKPEIECNRATIQEAMVEISRLTPLKFVESGSLPDRIVFGRENDPNCAGHSWVGRKSGPQELHLQPGASLHTTLHEICHSLGFIHTHSRPDRDRYISVKIHNCLVGYRDNFQIEGASVGPYDFASVMNYPVDSAFGRDVWAPLTAVRTWEPIGKPSKLSVGDVFVLRSIYGIPDWEAIHSTVDFNGVWNVRAFRCGPDTETPTPCLYSMTLTSNGSSGITGHGVFPPQELWSENISFEVTGLYSIYSGTASITINWRRYGSSDINVVVFTDRNHKARMMLGWWKTTEQQKGLIEMTC
ncbi:peptidase M12A family protein [Pelomyxa schiedti]|nr:peptidase M12A family protein [Pelomyxa schiedti]